MNPFQALIDVFAIIGVLCFGFLLAFAILWWISGFAIDQKITRPLPAEPFQATAEMREVQ